MAGTSGTVVWPLACHEAALTIAYAKLKCEELYGHQCWLGSVLSLGQIAADAKYPTVDFQAWARYGSWSHCSFCGSLSFNDQYFRDYVYQQQATSENAGMVSVHRMAIPSDPVVHSHGEIGVSSRWWYLAAMYKPSSTCGHCTPPDAELVPQPLPVRYRSKGAPRYTAVPEPPYRVRVPIQRTAQLYRVPRIRQAADPHPWARECVTWPRYRGGEFLLEDGPGESMLELTQEEQRALQVVCLRTQVKQEKYGAAHQVNWKKVGLSRAYYQKERVCEASMPTDRCRAALRFLLANNAFYRVFHREQQRRLDAKSSLNISSYDLFIVQSGIECAMYPHLYPTTDFTDTGIQEHYQHTYSDNSNRVLSIGYSWTRKVLSSVRVYAEQRDLSFFLYEKHLAMKYFSAHTRAQRMGLTGDVLARSSQVSSGYWEIIQDSLADLVRIMLERCYDQEGHKDLYDHVRGLRGQVWLCAYPNLFITIAPAEWKFHLPYFIQPYLQCVWAGAYLMALHMYFLVRSMWLFLATRHGHKFFVVFEWVMKTEYQGRGTPHWHIAAWVICHGILARLAGRTGTRVVSPFVKFLAALFQCEIDVQVGNGRLNYINGYVSKDHDAVDVGLGEYTQKGATAPWLAAYRLLSKSTPCIPEVAIRLAHLSEWERSYTHVLLYPPQPAAMLTAESRQGNFSSKMYGAYLADQRQLVSHGAPIAQSFLAWHRERQWDTEKDEVSYRGGRHQQTRTPTMAVACRYWYELTDGYWGQFVLTQIPHQYPQDLLPRGRHLTSMQNFAGMLEYLCSWVWRAEGIVESSGGCLVSTGSLPFLIDDAGQPLHLGEYVAGRSVFTTEAEAYNYILDIAARDLQYRGFRDDRVANFRHDTSSQ